MYLYLYTYPMIYVGYRKIIRAEKTQLEKLVAVHIVCSAEIATQPTGGLWRGTAVAAAGVESQTGAELYS